MLHGLTSTNQMEAALSVLTSYLEQQRRQQPQADRGVGADARRSVVPSGRERGRSRTALPATSSATSADALMSPYRSNVLNPLGGTRAPGTAAARWTSARAVAKRSMWGQAAVGPAALEWQVRGAAESGS